MNILNKPLVTFCFNINNQLWEQDLANDQLFNRIYDVHTSRKNQISSIPRQSLENYYQKHTSNGQTYNQNVCQIRNIDIESKLIFNNDLILPKDCPTIQQIKNLNDLKSSSNKQIYHKYHKHEVNSLCYPNLDNQIFDNTSEMHNCIVGTTN